ncbi:hypothetical protein ACWGQ4_03625 [Streptomyces sp. NPDC055721]|uniref:hypothetical protein n=1 Tax=Streptomyces sp. NPDC127132 TaxID=3345374 RepID=UPI00362D5A3D
MQKFDTPAPVSVVLDIPAGRIRTNAADRTDTTVEVLPLDASKSRDVKAADGAPALTIHATTTHGDIFARSL